MPTVHPQQILLVFVRENYSQQNKTVRTRHYRQCLRKKQDHVRMQVLEEDGHIDP